MKILIIRFSSIGDIVLTTPIVRCIKQQIKGCELHFLTKKSFEHLLSSNPHIAKVHLLENRESLTIKKLKQEKFDYIIDLHHNLRTLKFKNGLGVTSYSFPKLNFKKWLLTHFKIDKMPKLHVVDRYFETVKPLGVKNDFIGLDFFTDENVSILGKVPKCSFITVAVGAKFKTKQLPIEKLIAICKGMKTPILLLGGKEDIVRGEALKNALHDQQIENWCGKLSIQESAEMVKHSKLLLTHDTGLMHIASAFQTKIVSVWGNTVPSLGMYPYRPENENSFSIHEVNNLSCRPCSKIGYDKCPKKHFKCMENQDVQAIQNAITRFLKA